jgi:hypothetical protein
VSYTSSLMPSRCRKLTTRLPACVVGASVICIDKIIQLFPGYRKFKIEDNNTFLSSSLSLSFGVMVCISPGANPAPHAD